MFSAQTIQMQGTTPTVLYSPWFPRGGDYGVFTLDVVGIGGSGTPTLTVAFFHKNSSDPGDGDLAADGTGSTISRTATGRSSLDLADGVGGTTAMAGFKELVRYEFTISGGATNITSWATFRMLSIVWYDKV